MIRQQNGFLIFLDSKKNQYIKFLQNNSALEKIMSHFKLHFSDTHYYLQSYNGFNEYVKISNNIYVYS